MDSLWEKVTGWLMGALLLVVGAWMALFRKQRNQSNTQHLENNADLRRKYEIAMAKLEEHKSMLVDHDKRLEVLGVHIVRFGDDMTEIKTRLGNVHQRITESNKAVTDKLDRILERSGK